MCITYTLTLTYTNISFHVFGSIFVSWNYLQKLRFHSNKICSSETVIFQFFLGFFAMTYAFFTLNYFPQQKLAKTLLIFLR